MLIVKLTKFLHAMGILLSMEVVQINGPQQLYWKKEGDEFFPAMNYGKLKKWNHFQEVLKYMQFSFDKEEDQEILDFVEALNKQFQNSVTPGSYLTLDKSMIKSLNRSLLKGKIKIVCKLHPIMTEIKNLSNAASNMPSFSNAFLPWCSLPNLTYSTMNSRGQLTRP